MWIFIFTSQGVKLGSYISIIPENFGYTIEI